MLVPSLGGEDPLEAGMVIHSSILVWRIPWTEKPGGLQSIGSQRVGHDFSSLARMPKHNKLTCWSEASLFEMLPKSKVDMRKAVVICSTWVSPPHKGHNHLQSVHQRSLMKAYSSRQNSILVTISSA